MICMKLGELYGFDAWEELWEAIETIRSMGMSDEEINKMLERSETKKESEGITREDCEHRIAEKLKEIKKIVEEYAPKDDYLTLCIRGKFIDFNNSYWKYDKPNILNYHENTDTGEHQHFNMEE